MPSSSSKGVAKDPLNIKGEKKGKGDALTRFKKMTNGNCGLCGKGPRAFIMTDLGALFQAVLNRGGNAHVVTAETGANYSAKRLFMISNQA